MSKRKRLLIAHNVRRARTGGMSRIMSFIHDQFEAEGHQVEYFCAEDLPSNMQGRWARFTFPYLVSEHAVRAARKGKPYDLINVHEPAAAIVALRKRWAGYPRIVVTSHGVEQRGWHLQKDEVRLGRDSLSLKSRITYPLTSLWQSNLGLRLADHVFCLSSQDRGYLNEKFGIPAGRITRIFPAADAAYAPVATERTYEHVENLLFFGTWLKRKGISDLVAAFTVLVERHPHLGLMILGAGMPEGVVRADFPEALRGKIRCVETSTEETVAASLSAADIFVLPSLFEGTPQTLIEAMAAGMPVVTTAASGMRDVIESEHNGLLVPVRSPESIVTAVERLIADKDLRMRLGRQANADALRHYIWDVVAVPVREVYERLWEERG